MIGATCTCTARSWRLFSSDMHLGISSVHGMATRDVGVWVSLSVQADATRHAMASRRYCSLSLKLVFVVG